MVCCMGSRLPLLLAACSNISDRTLLMFACESRRAISRARYQQFIGSSSIACNHCNRTASHLPCGHAAQSARVDTAARAQPLLHRHSNATTATENHQRAVAQHSCELTDKRFQPSHRMCTIMLTTRGGGECCGQPGRGGRRHAFQEASRSRSSSHCGSPKLRWLQRVTVTVAAVWSMRASSSFLPTARTIHPSTSPSSTCSAACTRPRERHGTAPHAHLAGVRNTCVGSYSAPSVIGMHYMTRSHRSATCRLQTDEFMWVRVWRCQPELSELGALASSLS